MVAADVIVGERAIRGIATRYRWRRLPALRSVYRPSKNATQQSSAATSASRRRRCRARVVGTGSARLPPSHVPWSASPRPTPVSHDAPAGSDWRCAAGACLAVARRLSHPAFRRHVPASFQRFAMSALPIRLLTSAAGATAALVLSACVVVPVNPDGSLYQGPVAGGVAPVVVPAAPTSLTLPVRLYPTNEAAAATGMVSGSVTSHLNGKGTFTLHVSGETMSGEATRSGSGSRQGVASAFGARGSYANCQYTMNTMSQGTGRCTFSTGALYQLHIGG
jgi:hypothetical protein